ncbi:BON domain-containing protein [Cupriavidus gilardii J11]|uniref:BON domain-containing protein n=1 Tax=Cupriavidus gilardii J11 TaxID=936133 RepID=A0A562BNM8_9BURK|nr:peptidoglycan-binding protein LysM [Cupriavidus gilardii]TWG86787.1 BON domain-containing protein [Cupriavidus gilardii J11]
MSMLDFIKEAGERLFRPGDAVLASTGGSSPAPTVGEAQQKSELANRAAGAAIEDYIRKMDLDATGLSVEVDGAKGLVTVYGVAPDQATREKILLCCGNVQGVEKVEDRMSVRVDSDPASWHTVRKGDTLWDIAKTFYGNGAEYKAIFEANRPMLIHPDKIYPGQKLRIPPKA